MNSLNEVRTTLKLALGSDALFGLINTRVALATGIDLEAVSPLQDADAALVQRVLQTLATLGFPAQNLLTVARNKRA